MKLQNAILKDMGKHDDKNTRALYMITTGVSDFLDMGITDGHFIKFYSKKHMYINTSNDYFNPSPCNVSGIIDGFKAAERLTLVNERVILNGNTLVKLLQENGTPVFINEKYLDFFTSKYIDISDFTYYAVNYKSPVYLTINGTIHGVIFPVNVNGKNGGANNE